MFRSRRRGILGPNTGVLLLIFQMFQAGFDRIPPVTLGTIALNVGVYLGLIHQFFKKRLPSPSEICIGIQPVWQYEEYSRLLQGAFFHADDLHLYYNMVSFLWKGIYLERRVGSAWFLYMISVFTIAVNVLLLYLNFVAAHVLNDYSYLNDCAIGFSGVVFAIKVVTTYNMPEGTTMVMGFIPVNTKLACWVELALIQFLVPNASFTGHLAGILVGLAYVKGPLHHIMEFFSSAFCTARELRHRTRTSYTYKSGTTSRDENYYNRNNLYTEYTGGVDEDEQLRRAMRESNRETTDSERIYPDLNNPHQPSAPPPPGWNIPEDQHETSFDEQQMRQRRLERFGRT